VVPGSEHRLSWGLESIEAVYFKSPRSLASLWLGS
jgi:hypothetical protein